MTKRLRTHRRDAEMAGHRSRGRGGRGGRRRRSMPEPPPTTTDELTAWFAGNLPSSWFDGPPEIVFDRDEILVTGSLSTPDIGESGETAVAETARIQAFREDTREQRITIAERAQERFLRNVSWAATCGQTDAAFTTASVPVMTRLSLEERAVLDTLLEAGVARSRSEALAWCVRLVGENQAEWIGRLREAMKAVEEVRSEGPDG